MSTLYAMTYGLAEGDAIPADRLTYSPRHGRTADGSRIVFRAGATGLERGNLFPIVPADVPAGERVASRSYVIEGGQPTERITLVGLEDARTMRAEEIRQERQAAIVAAVEPMDEQRVLAGVYGSDLQAVLVAWEQELAVAEGEALALVEAATTSADAWAVAPIWPAVPEAFAP